MRRMWLMALSVLSVAALLGTGLAFAAAGTNSDTTTTTTTTSTQPLLTDQQIVDLRELARELQGTGLNMTLTNALVRAQMEQYIAANLESYGLNETEITQVMEMFSAIDGKLAEIKQTADNMTAQGATLDEMVAAISPLVTELQDLKDTLRTTLESYGITMNIPQALHERPEGPRFPPMPRDSNATTDGITFSPTTGCHR